MVFEIILLSIFPNEKANDKKIAALRFLKKKSKEFSFKLSSKDIFLAELERA